MSDTTHVVHPGETAAAVQELQGKLKSIRDAQDAHHNQLSAKVDKVADDQRDRHHHLEKRMDGLLLKLAASHNTAKWVLGVVGLVLIIGVYLGIKLW